MHALLEIPWEYVFGSAGGASVAVVLLVLFARTLIERSVEGAFGARLEQLKSELTRGIEFDKSDLTVWMELRKQILAEIWAAHREILKAMSAVIWRMQEIVRDAGIDPRAQSLGSSVRPVMEKLRGRIDEYRRLLHDNIHLLAPETLDDCQDFLNRAYQVTEMDGAGSMALEDEYERMFEGENELKTIRTRFARRITRLYGMEKMMPWMAAT